MSETVPVSPIARAIGGDSEEPDKAITCAVCGAQTVCPGYIVESVKLWNREEERLALANGRPADFIRPSQMGIACPGECSYELARRKHAEAIEEFATTRAYLAMLHVGNYNAESLAWLRNHGLGAQVARLLAKEGTAKSNG